MFKKKEKINAQEVFDSLLFSFDLEKMGDTYIRFKLLSESDKHNSMRFTISSMELSGDRNKAKIFDKEKDYAPMLFPCFRVQVKDDEVVSYILMLKDFLDNTSHIEMEIVGQEHKSVHYKISSYYHVNIQNKDLGEISSRFKLELEYHESDVYPSVSKYIINTASDAMYKKTL